MMDLGEKMNKVTLVILIILLQACQNEGKQNSENMEKEIRTTINFTELPNSFTYNLDGAPNGGAEYQWEILFDINNDRTISEGDISFRIDLTASDNTGQTTISRDNLTAYIWVYGDGVSYVSIRDVEIEYLSTDTSFTFIADSGKHEGISSISNGTQLYVNTIYRDRDSGVYYYDYYPEREVYSEGIDTSYIEDGIKDFENNLGPVSGKNYPLIDIEKISVVVNET